MAGNFTVLTEHQAAWIKRAVKQMIELTGYYSITKFPLNEEDYDFICTRFSDYAKKSRNNAMIIHYSGALTEYLDGLGKQSGKYQKMNKDQMQLVEQFTEEQFSLVEKWQGNLNDTNDLQNANQELDLCAKKYPAHELIYDLANMFQKYLQFCLKENIGKQMMEQMQEKIAEREPPFTAGAEPEKKHTKSR